MFNIDTDLIKKLIQNSSEVILLVDAEANVLSMNVSAQNLIGKIQNLKKIEHLFSFDICVINNSEILTYNPISAGMDSCEEFFTCGLFQTDANFYRSITLKTIPCGKNKVFIINDVTSRVQEQEKTGQINSLSAEIAVLREQNKENSKLKNRAESLAVRTGLINRISLILRDSLELETIVQTTLNELSKTLGATYGFIGLYDLHDLSQHDYEHKYIYKISEEVNVFNVNFIEAGSVSKNSKISNCMDSNFSNEITVRIITPIFYKDEPYGVIELFRKSSRQKWNKEEISLIESVAAQVGTGIYQACLFEKIEKQNLSLEKTLVELKEAQTQLVQSEKMASLGQLVAGVAHEINSPLGTVNSNNDLLGKYVDKLDVNGSNLAILNDIYGINKEAIRRINNIVKSLKNFARIDEAKIKDVNIHEGLDSTVVLISHAAKDRINIIKDYGVIPKIECYPDALNQVFMNILMNACQSIENYGEIRIRTTCSNGMVQIFISDTGAGISSEHLNKIFDPGFTTKGVGVGTGLGLAISLSIIKKHNGTISVNSEKGKGTEFIITIPTVLEGIC